ncbi:putative cysteine protease atg4 [Penicillium rolfsii]|nr:putative cysteine protease atg4 [Penicillium rolfsii]
MTGVDLEKYKRIVQYFWDPEPKNDTTPESPIWCLGQQYTPTQPSKPHDTATDFLIPRPLDQASRAEQATTSVNDTGSAWPEAFLADFESRIWMTYRSHFAPIPRSKNPEATSSMTLGVRLRSQLMDSQGFTSDTGWGCMIRSGQSLLANALSILQFGRGETGEEDIGLKKNRSCWPCLQITLKRHIPYTDLSSAEPSHVGSILGNGLGHQRLPDVSKGPSRLRVYVTKDTSDVYEEQFIRLASDQSGEIQPTLILMGVRLGIDHVTSVYWDGLQEALQYPQSVGIAGGRPSASHYFVGAQNSHLFFLDPHFTRPAVPYRPDEALSVEELDTYHTRRLRRIHIKDMDPSMLIGFLIRNDADWADWKARVQSTTGKPIIHLVTGEPPIDAGHGRREALDEVEVLDDSDSDADALE